MKNRRFIWNPLKKRPDSNAPNQTEEQKPPQESSDVLHGGPLDSKIGSNDETFAKTSSRTEPGSNETSVQHTNHSQNDNVQSFNNTTTTNPRYFGLYQNVNNYYRTSIDSASQSVDSCISVPHSPRGRRNSNQARDLQRPSTPVYRPIPCKFKNIQVTDLCDIPDMMEYVKVYRETLSSGLFDRRGIIFLYNPSSRINSHTTKRYPPISVGDVGFFDSNGGFDTHFNVLDKKINKDSDYDQPPGLLDFKEYLVSQGRKDTDILDYQADGLIRGRRNKRSISENMIVKEYVSERMAEFVVENMDLPCASVYMPQTVDHISIRKPNPFSFFEDFIKIYGAMWIEFAKPRGVGRTKTQPVCVIGEVNRTPVWASASSLVPESLASAKVSQPDPASDVLVWSDISDDSLFTQAGPPIDCLVEGKAVPPRECIAVSAWMLQPPSQFARSMSELTGPLRSSLSRGRSRAASLK